MRRVNYQKGVLLWWKLASLPNVTVVGADWPNSLVPRFCRQSKLQLPSGYARLTPVTVRARLAAAPATRPERPLPETQQRQPQRVEGDLARIQQHRLSTPQTPFSSSPTVEVRTGRHAPILQCDATAAITRDHCPADYETGPRTEERRACTIFEGPCFNGDLRAKLGSPKTRACIFAGPGWGRI